MAKTRTAMKRGNTAQLIGRFEKDEYPDPITIKKWVKDALDGHTQSVKIRRSCVTVTYQKDDEPIYHVDFACYAAYNKDQKLYISKGKEHSEKENRFWELSDPKELFNLIKNRYSDEEEQAQFKRVIRYMKKWKSEKFETTGSAAPTGIALTVLAYDLFSPQYINEYMTLKTGTPSNLKDKRVLLLGCGSVGGYVAANLCQSGVCCIDILDKDILYVENVHRHILGFSDALKEKNKADLMSNYLEDHYPFAEIDPMNCVNRDVRELLKTPERLKNYDLIVSALGEPTINLEINKLLIEQKISVPFVVCFNEPYGIGGHAIAVNVTQGGCLRCLYSDILSGELISFSTSFVKEGQNFSKTISGCAGTYVEYSSLDTQQTALLTSRLCISVLKGETNTSTLLSWYGNSITLENNGFAVSDYYKTCISSSKYNGIITKIIRTNRGVSDVQNEASTIKVKIAPEVYKALKSFQSTNSFSVEFGGIIVGYYDTTENTYVVTDITWPQKNDIQAKYRFVRKDPAHQSIMDDLWEKSESVKSYLGEWHSHREKRPSPSWIDKSGWKKKAKEQKNYDICFFIIVGMEEIRCWYTNGKDIIPINVH